MSFLIPLLFCLGIGGTVQAAFSRRFEEALPVGLLFAGLLVYLAGMFNRMEWGVWLAVLFAAAFPALMLYWFFTDRNRFSQTLASFCTPGLLVFVLLYVTVFVLDYRRGLSWWDEYSHWAPMAKETFRLNQFYCAPASVLSVHREYPPFVTLFQYLWCKLCGGFDEPFLYRAYHTLSLCLFLPALRYINSFDKRKGLAAAACVLLAGIILVGSNLMIIEGAFLTSLLTDSFLGLIFAYCIGAVLLEDDRSAFSLAGLCIGLAAMVLVKKTAVYFVGLCVILAFGVSLLPRQENGIGQKRKSAAVSLLLRAIVTAVVPTLFYFSWQYVLRLNGESSSIGGIRLSELPGIWMDTSGDLSQRLSVIRFKNALFSQGLGTHPVNMTYLQLLVFFTGVYAVFAWVNRKNGASAGIALTGGVLLVGGVGYACAIMLSYLYFFSAYEAERLASYSRYMATYGQTMLTVAVLLLFRQFALCLRENKSQAVYRMALVFCGLVLCVPHALGSGFQPALTSYSLSREYTADCALLSAQTEPEDAVLVIAQGDTGLAGHVLQYELLPRKVDFISLGQPKYDGDVWSRDMTPEAFADLLRTYDYLYLYKTDDELRQRYPALFAPDSPITDGRLYAVQRDEEPAAPLLNTVSVEGEEYVE